MSDVTRTGKSPEQHAQELEQKLAKGLEKGMKMVEADAKMLVGVDTGVLRASLTSGIRKNSEGIIGMCGSNVEYAFFHSLQNPYLETALDKNLTGITESIKGEL